jgi:hypothetical protein
MDVATEKIGEISKITDRMYSHRITEHIIKDNVEKRFDKWLRTKKGKLYKTPIDKIKWGDLIHCSIWREAPFTFDSKNPDNEKGFRDALILETVIEICRQEKRQIGIAFLCNDKLLRETAEQILSTENRFSSRETIDDFESYLKLTKEKLEDQFIKSLLKRATQKFYSKEDPECLYMREKLRNKLEDEYKKYFDNPKESEKDFVRSFLSSTYSESWEPIDTGRFWISNAQFERIESKNQYYWKSQVTYVKQYTKRYGQISLLRSLIFQDYDNERVLILPFQIIWRAKVTANGRFSDLAIENIELKDNSFEKPTEQQRKRWGLRTIENITPTTDAGPVSGSFGT